MKNEKWIDRGLLLSVVSSAALTLGSINSILSKLDTFGPEIASEEKLPLAQLVTRRRVEDITSLTENILGIEVKKTLEFQCKGHVNGTTLSPEIVKRYYAEIDADIRFALPVEPDVCKWQTIHTEVKTDGSFLSDRLRTFALKCTDPKLSLLSFLTFISGLIILVIRKGKRADKKSKDEANLANAKEKRIDAGDYRITTDMSKVQTLKNYLLKFKTKDFQKLSRLVVAFDLKAHGAEELVYLNDVEDGWLNFFDTLNQKELLQLLDELKMEGIEVDDIRETDEVRNFTRALKSY